MLRELKTLWETMTAGWIASAAASRASQTFYESAESRIVKPANGFLVKTSAGLVMHGGEPAIYFDKTHARVVAKHREGTVLSVQEYLGEVKFRRESSGDGSSEAE